MNEDAPSPSLSRELLRAVYAEIAKTQRNGLLPVWFMHGCVSRTSKDAGDCVLLSFQHVPASAYPPDMSVEKGKHGRCLVKTDPVTGVKGYVLTIDFRDDEYVKLFEVEANPATGSIAVIKSTELGDFAPSPFDLYGDTKACMTFVDDGIYEFSLDQELDRQGNPERFTNDGHLLLPHSATSHLQENGMPPVGLEMQPDMILICKIGATEFHRPDALPGDLEIHASDEQALIKKYSHLFYDASFYTPEYAHGTVISARMEKSGSFQRAVVRLDTTQPKPSKYGDI